ncbi:MAG TPA: M20/M25/M40 family metallo-hydrolase, partial [Thermoanaerobaculia bacterium]
MKRRFLALVLLGGLLLIDCNRGEAVVEAPGEPEAEEWLVRYLQIDTSNPPGNETPAARFFQEILKREGIESRLLGSEPARQSIYARLASGSNEPALVLLHHLDVVPVVASEWSVPPFSGKRSGGYIWGRGALDIKSLGIAELSAFLDLKRQKIALRRDVIFLAVADEETGGLRGCKEILERHPELFQNVGFVLNEGGANETIVDRVSFWGIEVDEKIPLWIRLTVRSSAGHSAVPPDDGGSVAHLLRALTAIQQIPRPYRVTPNVARQLAMAAERKPDRGDALRDPARFFDAPDFEKRLSPSVRALLRDTLAITRIHAGTAVNTIPAEAFAELDLRLLEGSSPDAMLDKIRAAAGESVDLSVLLKEEKAPASPIESDLYRLLERVMKKAEPA